MCNISTSPSGDARVVRVVDGDTVEIAGGERVRYIGIDTPEVRERPEPFGRQATRYNARLVEGRRVKLERDVSETDRFGRLLRYVYVGDILVNAELVREGFAEAKVFPPDTRYSRCLSALEEEARRERRGLWSK
jgi:micrococcal nuclease